jgi:hypothetical protein
MVEWVRVLSLHILIFDIILNIKPSTRDRILWARCNIGNLRFHSCTFTEVNKYVWLKFVPVTSL